MNLNELTDVMIGKEPIGEATSLTGMTYTDIRGRLKEVLPPEAYSAVGGASYLTDINPAYLTEALTDCFGPCGIGWGYELDPDRLTVTQAERQGMKYEAQIVPLVFWYVLEGRRWMIPSTGGSANRTADWAIRGAITNAIGAAAAKLEWQIEVYKGNVDHTNADKVGRSNGTEPGMTSAPPTKGARPLGPADLVVAINKKAHELSEAGVCEITDGELGALVGELDKMFAGPTATEDRHAFLQAVYGTDSSKLISPAEAHALIKWAGIGKDVEGPGTGWSHDPTAEKEAILLISSLIRRGQYVRPEPEEPDPEEVAAVTD